MHYRHNRTYEISPLNDGLVLTDGERRVAHHLDKLAATVWRAADGRTHYEVIYAVSVAAELPLFEATVVSEAALKTLVEIEALVYDVYE